MFSRPDPGNASFIQDGKVGLVMLPVEQFRYSRDVGYAFELAVLAEAGTDRRLLFIRIDSWDPEYRKQAAPGEIDYCIPLAYDGAPEREKVLWTIPFGGAWSDTREEALLVLDSTWIAWFEKVETGLAFSNPGAESAAFMKIQDREAKAIRAFCSG
jgi:hypothetical protein